MWRARARRLVAAGLAAGALVLGGADGARAQGAAAPAGFEMTRSVQQSLKRLQELWLQWLGASLQNNPAREAEALRNLQTTARQIGFARLPDFALGAMARGVEAAREGDFARARRLADAAEALDPGRPEVAFASAEIARRQGSWGRFLVASASGFGRLLAAANRAPLASRIALWLLLAALLGAVFFVAIEAAMKGSALYGDAERWLSARMPAGAAIAVTCLVLIAPAALPGGPVWLALLWSVLLWGYGSHSERLAFALVWLALGLAPLGAAALQRRLALDQSPPMRAIEEFRAGRLTGTLFADLQVLRTALPEEPAVLELTADVHRSLGQWDLARAIYLQVVAKDGDVATALINLGADAFRKGDFAAANGYFQRAANATPPSAAAWYNLSQSYSETYQFDESRRSLARAREIDGTRVDHWIQTPNPDRVLTFNGGLARRDEIAGKLVEAWTGSEPQPGRLGRLQAPLAAALAALAALGLHLLRRSRGYGEPSAWLGWRSSALGRWSRALGPAISHTELGEGFAALGNVALLAALATLPGLAGLAGDFGSGEAVGRAARFVAAVAALVYVALRVRRELAAES
jgi:tetratricopeptide (TPR) repeat protein